MPSTIPYDPSLVLGNIVSQAQLENVEAISKVQAPADAAQDKMNALTELKRSLDMTIQEMVNMGLDTGDLMGEIRQVEDQLKQAAIEYANAKIKSEKDKLPLKSKIQNVHSEVESPIDYNRSQLKQMPISADSLQMNCQYFSHDENAQSSSTHASTVSAFVAESLSVFGDKQSMQASMSAQAQMNSQHSRHSISGTLVICVTCTHKNAQVFAPFILDVDKAVRAWNTIYEDKMIKTNDWGSIARIEAQSQTKDDKALHILSGATYGSSFVAMVHVLNVTDSQSSQHMESVAASLQETFDIGGWFASGTGSYGVSASFSDSAKNLLSSQNISSHCTMSTMGIIPSIKSNAVSLAVQSFADFDPGKTMESLATIQGATASDNDSVSSAAEAARTGQQMITLNNSKISSVLSSLSEIDDGQNQIIDTNSVMNALEDYINRCVSGGDNMGVPINYYLKPITQSDIARSWMAKYYPNRFNKAGSADDSSASGGSDDQGGDGSE